VSELHQTERIHVFSDEQEFILERKVVARMDRWMVSVHYVLYRSAENYTRSALLKMKLPREGGMMPLWESGHSLFR
jgi:hypothetical protein